MTLNLITDAWIPVRDRDGQVRTIAPWQMADRNLVWPAWPRTDLDIACIEFLVGLLWLADPPEDHDDWEDRRDPDPERLRQALAPYAPAFNLAGDGPRFMQELGGLEAEIRSPELLFLDSGGQGGALTVHEGRYPTLSLPMAAMALYAMQTQAPSGGRGMLTSLRGGGGLSVLLDPGQGLWSILWANVPNGRPSDAKYLPWMRKTIPSDTGAIHTPPKETKVESLFGMPRRYWLEVKGDRVTGVMQCPSGTRYVGWKHPFAPHYKQEDEVLPVRPRAGYFGYRHWQGIAMKGQSDLRIRSQNLVLWEERARGEKVDLIVAGWAMNNATALDYLFARPPLVEKEVSEHLSKMIDAADQVSQVLRGALPPLLADGEARELIRETFYIRTQTAFETHMESLSQDGADWSQIAPKWLNDMQRVAMKLFEAEALPSLGDRPMDDQATIVKAHNSLLLALAGYSRQGEAIFTKLGLFVPERKKKTKARKEKEST